MELSTVRCAKCGEFLIEDYRGHPMSRKPCPKCGSMNRHMNISQTIDISFDVNTVIKNAAIKVRSSANLVLKSLVIPESTTDEGVLIKAVDIPWLEIIKLLKDDPNAAFTIPSDKWEEIIAGAYKKANFDEVILTPRSGDFGRDVIAIKKGIGSIRIIDQVKAYKPSHLVTANDVRALMGILENDKASKGFLTTTSDFAPKIKDDPLIKPFIPTKLELTNGETLIKRLVDLL